MAIASKVVEAGGKKYTIQTYNSEKGLEIFSKLVTNCEPLLVGLIGASDDEDPNYSNLVMPFVKTMGNPDVSKLIPEMFKGYVFTEQGGEVNFSVEFTANYGTMLKVLIEIVKLNFLSFLEVGGSSLSQNPQA